MSEINLVDLPEINYEDTTPVDALIAFYKKLDWNPDTYILDPRCIKLSPNDYSNIYANIISIGKTENEKNSIAMMLVNKGPSQDSNIPDGKVWLQDDCFLFCDR